MAIDTAAKRRSAAGVPFLPLGPGVTPDASKPVAWRQQSAWGYSGIETTETEVVRGPITGTVRLLTKVSATILLRKKVTGTVSIDRD